jgi:hypothetical protein
VIFADRIRSVGKQARDESGKYPVNEEDEEIGTPCEYGNRDRAEQISLDACVLRSPRHCERSEAIQSVT